MSFSIPCECGSSVAVDTTQAGADVTCRCGRVLHVPKLSQLRLLQGKDSFEAGILDSVNRMIRTGELPAGNCCVISFMPTEGVAEITVQLESVYKKTPENENWFLLLLYFLFHPIHALNLSRNTTLEFLGRDTQVYLPLRVAPNSLPTLQKASKQQLRSYLWQTPIYAQLLKDYPAAQVIGVRQ